jgi:hypothetical protein
MIQNFDKNRQQKKTTPGVGVVLKSYYYPVSAQFSFERNKNDQSFFIR